MLNPNPEMWQRRHRGIALSRSSKFLPFNNSKNVPFELRGRQIRYRFTCDIPAPKLLFALAAKTEGKEFEQCLGIIDSFPLRSCHLKRDTSEPHCVSVVLWRLTLSDHLYSMMEHLLSHSAVETTWASRKAYNTSVLPNIQLLSDKSIHQSIKNMNWTGTPISFSFQISAPLQFLFLCMPDSEWSISYYTNGSLDKLFGIKEASEVHQFEYENERHEKPEHKLSGMGSARMWWVLRKLFSKRINAEKYTGCLPLLNSSIYRASLLSQDMSWIHTLVKRYVRAKELWSTLSRKYTGTIKSQKTRL